MMPQQTASTIGMVNEESACPVTTVEEIRSQFPALDRLFNGHPIAYFDGPGGTQTPRVVVDAIAEYLYDRNANTHWNYPTSRETDDVIAHARAAAADLLGADPEEIVFGANATTLAFHLSRALARTFQQGDEIVVTELDHHANVGPWQALAAESGATLQAVRMDVATGQLDWDDLVAKVTPATRLVAVGAASNALGTINDVSRVVELARSVGALTMVDAVHYAPHRLVDVRAWNCDFAMCSAYKFYGPHVGALYCRRELLESLPFAKVRPASEAAPDRAETGTLNHEGLAGATAAVEFLAGLARGPSRRPALATALEALDRRGLELASQMWGGLAEINGVTLFGPPPDLPRTATVAFTVKGLAAGDVATALAQRGVFVSHGDFYAQTVVERLQLAPAGLVRAGCACYTTADEVTRLVDGVRELTARH